MGSLSTRRVIERSAPAKITIVEGKGGWAGGGGASNKENMVNCSLYSLFETHYDRSNSPSTAGHPQAGHNARGKMMKNVLQPRKRCHIDLTIPQPDAGDCSRELSPPELTTSDTFKPAKRTLAAAPNNKNPAEEDGHKQQLPKILTQRPAATSESCDVLVSSPTELKGEPVSEMQQQSKIASSSGRRDVTRKTPTQGRRFSIIRVSISREGGALLNSKRDGNSFAKKHSRSIASEQQARVVPPELNGRDMVFSSKNRTSVAKQSNRVQTEVEKGRLRVLERRKSVGLKTTSPVGKQGIGSFGGGRLDIFKKDGGSDKMSSPIQQTKSASKTMADSIRTRKLSMVLKSEQRLVEKNEQCTIQLRHLQDQMDEKDHEMERLRSAALMLNNMINRQSEEIRELRFRLKETFNENAEVRDLCETLERELRKARESLRLERMQQEPTKPCETKLASLTTQFQSLAVGGMEPHMIESCIEEGQEDSESQGEPESHKDSQDREDSQGQGVTSQDLVSRGRSKSNENLLIQTDEDAQYTLQDLREMVMQEEDLLKERCANALKELDLPLTPFLTPKGSLDVGSLKAMLASISSREEYLTAERVGSIHRLSAWIGSSREGFDSSEKNS